MDKALEKQCRREILDLLRADGGQTSWSRLMLWEYELLQNMEAEGLIERVTDEDHRRLLTYRLKSEAAGSNL